MRNEYKMQSPEGKGPLEEVVVDQCRILKRILKNESLK
jgi:hypothetical protein